MKRVLVNGPIKLIVCFPGFMESFPFKEFISFLSADTAQLSFDDYFLDLSIIFNREEIRKTIEKLGFVMEITAGNGNGAYIILRGAGGGSIE